MSLRRLFLASLGVTLLACDSFGVPAAPMAGDAGDAQPLAPPPDPGDASVNADADAGPPPPPPEPFARWTFDVLGASNAIDSSGRGNPLSFVSSNVTISNEGPHAGAGTLLCLGGSAWAEQNDIDEEDFPRAGTLSLWFITNEGLPALGSSVARNLFDSASNDRRQFVLGMTAKAPLGLQLVVRAPNAELVQTTVQIDLSVWYHAVFTWTAGHVALYLDGALAGAGEYDPKFEPSDQWVHFGKNFKGKIDEVTMWDVALSAAQIAVLK